MNEKVILHGASVHPGGKALIVDGTVASEATDQAASRKVYFPLSQCRANENGEYECPMWLARAKAGDAVYQWVSSRGAKGIDHLGGAGLTASFAGATYYVDLGDLRKAERYANR